MLFNDWSHILPRKIGDNFLIAFEYNPVARTLEAVWQTRVDGKVVRLIAGSGVLAAYTAILCLAGFFIYGPQALVGIHAANLATKRAAATAIGLTGLFAYADAVRQAA